MTKNQIRELAGHVARAHAALTALDGGHCHDGRPLPGRERTLAQAIEAIRAASRLVGASETPGRGGGTIGANKSKGDPAGVQGGGIKR